MRVVTFLLTVLLVGAAFALLTAAPAPSTDGTAAAPAVSADAGQAADAMAGCPGKMNGGSCCAGCQAQTQAAGPAGAAEKPAGCPCQERARRLREAQERARQQ